MSKAGTISLFVFAIAAAAPAAPVAARNVLSEYCTDCHDAADQEGDVRLDNLETLSLEARLDLLNRVQEQVFLGEMPPKKKAQPTEAERDQLIEWIGGELRKHNASKLEEKLRMPEYGNVVDHGKLFSGKYRDIPGFTPDRRWLISEFIFDAKFNKLLDHVGQRDIDGKRQNVIGANHRNGVNLTNPFLLPTHSGVRYYDTTTLDGGHLLTMITNAKETAAFLINTARRRKNFLPVVEKIMATEWAHETTLAARGSWLNANIEPLLCDLYKEKHEALLPKFVPSKFEAPKEARSADGTVLKKSVFDIAKPSNEELAEIWAAMERNSQGGEKDEALVMKCEKEWFHYGVNERTLQSRLQFMRGYMEDLLKRKPKNNTAKAPKPPIEAEIAVIRTAVLQHRKTGDTYAAVVAKCMAGWSDEFQQERIKAGLPNDTVTAELVEQLFTRIIERAPTSKEKTEYCELTKNYWPKLGIRASIDKLIQTLILRSDFVYRNEFGEGPADEHGRRMLSPRDASYAIAYALTDSSPDKQLAEAAANGKLNTREDYRREVERLLKARSQYYIIDESVDSLGREASFTNLPIRKLRFFREFFGYPQMLPIFKDNKRFGGNYENATKRLVAEADMLVEFILIKDQNVFETLLSTENFYVYHSGNNTAMTAASENVRKIYEYFKDKDWQNFDADKLKEHRAFLTEVPLRGVPSESLGEKLGRNDTLRTFKIALASYTERMNKGQTSAVPFPAFSSHAMTEAQTRLGTHLNGAEVAKAWNLDLANWSYPADQPAKMQNRKGMLTHPAWLIAFAGNTATDPVRRGKWVREKLLAGTVPDVPVTVDAVVPEDHHATLRTRLAKVTEAEYCWKCHERMNPLGYTLEMYDDFGRFRTHESLENPGNLLKKMPDKGQPHEDLRDIYKTLPIEAKGHLAGTGDPMLDGDVKDALDLAERLAKSTKVRQSIIRHAFRYFMGRNEFLSDSKTLMDADEAYVKSGGSFDAVILSLLTSDSFIYRKPTTN